MDVLSIALEWARAEAQTASYFVGFGLLFIVFSIGVWRLGETKMAKAYIFPMLIAGILLIVLGSLLFDLYDSNIESLKTKYNENPSEFIETEIQRTKASIAQYKRDLFDVFPFVMGFSALMMIFIKRKIWRAIFITLIAMSTVIMLVDSQAIALLEEYNRNLNELMK